jgi:hypothetical protein
MTMDQGSEKLSAVHPVLAAKVRAAAENLAARGVEIRVVQGMRTADEQDALYAKGRTVLMYSQGKAQPIVTKARGGYSSHNLVLGARAWTPNWVVSSDGFKAMVLELKAERLLWGGDWKTMRGDYDHFYLPSSPTTPTDAMRAALAAGGLSQVVRGLRPRQVCVTLRSSVDLEGELAQVRTDPPPAQMRGLETEWIGKLQSLTDALRKCEWRERRRKA